MEKEFLIKIGKVDARKCIDFTNPLQPKFLNKKDLASNEGSLTYSEVLTKEIKKTYNTTLAVGNGKAVGKFSVSVYMECAHGAKFHVKMPRKKFVANSDLTFSISRTKHKTECTCGICKICYFF